MLSNQAGHVRTSLRRNRGWKTSELCTRNGRFSTYNTLQVKEMCANGPQMIVGREISKRYGEVPALDRVSFEFDRSQILGVIGHNGAGKTTLLKILAGLIPPTGGELEIDGMDMTRNPDGMKQMIGYLPEESRLYESMKVDEYLRFFGEIYGLGKGEIRKREHELLSWLALEPNGKKMGEFSKGMKRKAAIARSLIHDPSILIYDEATSGLDPMTSRHIVEFMRDLRSCGKTIILSAHNLYQVEAICDRILILRRGQRVAFGTMQELREMFGSVSYRIFFTVPDVSKVQALADVETDGGYYRARAGSIEEMNALTGSIGKAEGVVQRIESHYPSLEEMLVKIGA